MCDLDADHEALRLVERGTNWIEIWMNSCSAKMVLIVKSVPEFIVNYPKPLINGGQQL